MLSRWGFFPAAKDCPGMHEMRMSVRRKEWGIPDGTIEGSRLTGARIRCE
jgi:hypothetical protein